MFNVLFWSDNLEQHKTDIRNFSTLHKGFFPYTKLLGTYGHFEWIQTLN
ncbi:hypothetical protein ALT721_1880029 [Alteromonas alvinellae]